MYSSVILDAKLFTIWIKNQVILESIALLKYVVFQNSRPHGTLVDKWNPHLEGVYMLKRKRDFLKFLRFFLTVFVWKQVWTSEMC